MDEELYDLFESTDCPDIYIAVIRNTEAAFNYKPIYEVQKVLTDRGFVITECKAPYIHCVKVK